MKIDIINNPQKYSDCDIRIRMGRFYTNEEYQKEMQKRLSRKLPN